MDAACHCCVEKPQRRISSALLHVSRSCFSLPMNTTPGGHSCTHRPRQRACLRRYSHLDNAENGHKSGEASLLPQYDEIEEKEGIRWGGWAMWKLLCLGRVTCDV